MKFQKLFKYFRKIISLVLIIAFVGSSLYVPKAYGSTGLLPDATKEQGILPRLPPPGVMVHLSPEFIPAHLQGLTIHPDNALQFDFLIHQGDGQLDNDQKKEEYTKLVKYFLASLTIPDEDQWVNLSPYEHDRIIKSDFGKTEMGRDLLSQDYLLKQITSSLMYPESGLGKVFWDRIYERAYKEYGTTNVPVNTFNKVWIIPDEAAVYESGNTVYILRNHLKVMLEEDYLSLEKHSGITSNPVILSPRLKHSGVNSAKDLKTSLDSSATPQNDVHGLGSQVIREIMLPELEKEVNEGKNFAMLRQIYSGMILAAWYKHALKESLLGKVYANQAKVKGVNQDDPKANVQIYQRYLRAFKKGVFNYIKEDVDKYTNEIIPRKYFSGGTVGFPNGARDDKDGTMAAGTVEILHPDSRFPPNVVIDPAMLSNDGIDRAAVTLNTAPQDAAMLGSFKKMTVAAVLIMSSFIPHLAHAQVGNGQSSKVEIRAPSKEGVEILLDKFVNAKNADDVAGIQATLIEDIKRTGADALDPMIAYVLSDSNTSEGKKKVIRLLGASGEPWVRQALMKALDGSDNSVLREYMMEALASSDLESKVIGIQYAGEYLFNHPIPSNGENGYSKNLLEKILSLDGDESPEVRAALIGLSSSVPGGKQLSRNKDYSDPDHRVRLAAVKAHSGDDPYLYIMSLRHDKSPEVRAAVMDQLGFFQNGHDILSTLKQAFFEDPNLEVRTAALQSIVDLQGSDIFQFVLEQTYNKDPEIRKVASEGLHHNALQVINYINSRHDANDAVRFSPVTGFDAKMLYYLIVEGQGEIYTSSFNGLYQRLREKMQSQPLSGEEILRQVNEYKFREFFELLTNYNHLNDFLKTMSDKDSHDYMRRFVQGIEKSSDPDADAVAVAQTLTLTKGDTLKIMQETITQELKRVQDAGDKKGIVLYSLLNGMFVENPVINKQWFKDIAVKYNLPNLSGLSHDDLFSKNDGTFVQRNYFFNDPQDNDGIYSFLNFLRTFNADSANWQIIQNKGQGTVIIRSRKGHGNKIEIYANDPRVENANEAVDNLLKIAKLEPNSYFFRGHSYFAGDFKKLLQQNAKSVLNAVFINWGSCGGYDNIRPSIEMAPFAQILSTQGIGARSINDPLNLIILNNARKGSINWDEVWRQAEETLGRNENFGDYIRPDMNFGALFLRILREQEGASTPRDEQEIPIIRVTVGQPDGAMVSGSTKGGIDLNAANLNLLIKRDGAGVPLPINMQDMEQLKNIQGFVPEIIEIKPAVSLPILSELQQKFQSLSAASSGT